MQSTSPDFIYAITNKWKRPGVQILIDGFPYVIVFGRGWTIVPTQEYRIVVYGEGFKFGDTNPLTGQVLKFGDSVSEGQTGGLPLHNLLEFGEFECTFDPRKRVPNIPKIEIILGRPDLMALVDDPTGHEAEVRINYNNNAMDSIVLFNGTVTSWGEDEEGITYHLVIESVLGKLKKKIMGLPTTELTAGMLSNATAASVNFPQDYTAPGYVRIGDDLFKYSGTSATQLTGLYRLNAIQAAHDKGDVVQYVQYWEGREKLINILLTLLTNTGVQSNGAWDIAKYEEVGCGIPIDKINLSTFTGYIDPAGNTNSYFDLIYYSEKSASDIIEPILAALNAFLMVRNDGTISLIPDATPGISTIIDETTMRDYMRKTRGAAINKITWNCNVYEQMHNARNDKISVYDAPSISLNSEQSITYELSIMNTWIKRGHGKLPPDADPDDPIYHDNDPRYVHLMKAAQYAVLRYKTPYYQYAVPLHWNKLIYELCDGFNYDSNIATINIRRINLKDWQAELGGILPAS